MHTTAHRHTRARTGTHGRAHTRARTGTHATTGTSEHAARTNEQAAPALRKTSSSTAVHVRVAGR
eukprot:4322963-Prymnesium_polylepis.1